MALEGTIAHIDGVPHVCVSMMSEFAPVELLRYWPLVGAAGRVQEGEVCTVEDGTCRVGCFAARRDFRLPQGGATRAQLVERDVPKPRTRCEVRWYRGRWEKLSKRLGWVPA